MKFDTIVIRYGEIGLKSKQTRRKFISKLIRNMKEALREDFIDYEDIRKEFGRLYVDTDEPAALKALSKVFGIISISPAQYTQPSLNSISKLSLELAKKHIKSRDTFAIRARRSGGQEFTSLELGNKVGAVVRKETKAKVDLKNPKKELFIEVRVKRAYVFLKKIPGPGGIPKGIEGKVLGLYSSGPGFKKAIYHMGKRGCDVEVLCTESEKEKAERAVNGLKACLGSVKVHAIKKPKNKAELIKTANKLCREIDAKALVTADKVSKSNLKKIAEIDKLSKFPIFRPLL